MTREPVPPRPDWPARVERSGYTWHTEDGEPAWREDAGYILSAAETQLLRQRAHEGYRLYEQAAEEVVRRAWWSRVGICETDAPMIRASWERRDWSLAGRFDFLYDENGDPKLLEFNADNALTLLETAVIQREWQRDLFPDASQWNDLHPRLVEAWRTSGQRHIHCAWRPRHREIEGSVRYVARTIREAGLEATLTALHCLGWDRDTQRFVDLAGQTVACCYKFYPWAWLLREPFAPQLAQDRCAWVEPAWRQLFTSKGLLPILWELFPGHPVLAPCRLDDGQLADGWVRKPLFGREGNNVTIAAAGRILQQTAGDFPDAPCIQQQFIRSPRHGGYLAQLGVWMVGPEAVALGIRESQNWIIDADSTFVPHLVR